MILLEIIFLAISLFLFLVLKKLPIAKRIIIAAIVFLVLSVSALGLIVYVGDKPLPGSVTVNPNDV